MYGYQDIFAEFVEETIFADIVDETIEATIVEETILADIVDETLLLEIMETEELQVDLSAEEIIVEVESWSCPQISGGGGGYIFITNITTSGIAANHEYEPDTVPADSVLTSVTVDSNDCTVHFIAEGGVGYSPRVEIDGVFCSNLQEVSQDKRLFTGSIPVTISETTNITIRSSTNQRDSAVIIRASAAPEILSCSIGDYPGTQTAAKQGDLIHVTGVVEESATHVRLMGYGAFQDSGWVPCSGGTFDITGTIGSASGTYGARVYTKNAMGSESVSFDSSNQILLDQDSPVFIDLGTTFPNGQSALKGTEMAIQGTRVLDFTSVIYSSPHGDISVVNPSSYVEDKIVQCMNPGDYNDSFNNFKIEAYKTSNDTSNIFQKNIEVADIAPIV
ncbi:MAG: hypothetical protein U9N73_00885, partial [Candidatus Auribacterota bacterium]|nr:hypothetical protein [Candidatus Auribacterota bacterium]